MSGFTRNPASASHSSTPHWVSRPRESGSCTAYMNVESSRDAVTAGSFMRIDPAAALRGFANAGRPASTCCSLRRSNAPRGMYASPRTSTKAGGSSISRRSGTDMTVRMLAVMSSPTSPSPRVEARSSTPSR